MSQLLNQTNEHGTISPFGKRGDDRFVVSIPAGEIFDASQLTVLETRLRAGANITVQPSAGQTNSGEVVVHWWYDAGSMVKYQIEAFSKLKDEAPKPGPRTTFLPSKYGFKFGNSFSSRPDIIIHTPFGDIGIGDASNGLCGGMVYAALDYCNAHQPIPLDPTPPDGGPLFDYIVTRLFDSFDLPTGVEKYLTLMHPALPDHETDASKLGLAPHGRAWRMIREEWPLIKADIDAGKPSPLGLVCVKSVDPTELGHNHQVLAYGYDLKGNDLTLCIYDPNIPSDDNVTLRLNIGDPEHTTAVTYSTGRTVYAFFRTSYTPKSPPLGIGTTVNIHLRANNAQYVCAEGGGGTQVVANRTVAREWETIALLDQNGASLRSGDQVALRTYNGQYICAEDGGGREVVANRGAIGPWETFVVIHADGLGGDITNGQHIALRAYNGQYICAEDGGGREVVANRGAIGPWETFTIEIA